MSQDSESPISNLKLCIFVDANVTRLREANLKSQTMYFLAIVDWRMSQDSESPISNLKLCFFWRLATGECHSPISTLRPTNLRNSGQRTE